MNSIYVIRLTEVESNPSIELFEDATELFSQTARQVWFIP